MNWLYKRLYSFSKQILLGLILTFMLDTPASAAQNAIGGSPVIMVQGYQWLGWGFGSFTPQWRIYDGNGGQYMDWFWPNLASNKEWHWPSVNGSAGDVLTSGGGNPMTLTWTTPSTGITGSGTDKYMARWNGPNAVQDSVWYIGDAGSPQITYDDGTDGLYVLPVGGFWIASSLAGNNLLVGSVYSDPAFRYSIDVSGKAGWGDGTNPADVTLERNSAGRLLLTGALETTDSIRSLSPSNPIGYEVGAGNTVTQITSKATAVTVNANTGQITTDNAALNAGAEVTFVVNDSSVAATDVIIINLQSGGSANSYYVGIGAVGAGSFTVILSNLGPVNLNQALVLNFAVIKGQVS